MSKVLLAGAVLAIYLILGTLLAFISRKRLMEGLDDFFTAKGRLGGFLSAMTYAATTYSGFMIVGLVGFAYYTGVGSLGFELAYFVATISLLVLFARKVRTMARERKWITPSQMLGDLLGSRKVAVIVSLIYLVALVPYAASQLKSIGESIAGMAGGYYKLGVIIGLIIIVIWSMIAGIWSIAVTDALQGLWMIFSAFLLLGYVLWIWNTNAGDLASAWTVLKEANLTGLDGFWTLNMFLAFTLPWIFFAVTNPQVVQRLYMPKDEKSLRDMIRWFGVFGLIYTIIVTLVGLYTRASVEAGYLSISPTSKDEVTPLLLATMNPLFAGIIFTSIIAASASTADSILLTLSSVVAVDLVEGSEVKKKKAALTAIIIVGVVMAAVAISRVSYIVQLSVLSSLILLSLAPITIAAWTKGIDNPTLATLSILTGPIIVAIITIIKGSPLAAFAATLLGLPIAAWILLISTILLLPAIKR
ncbi:MAG: sodium:solute symporter family protein [Desulfurococcales archaeon]|nr:sodium:solute symporter family protein [Desulfurococcales archaeon]MCE4626829.1 sodium:solute symporter family protein [Desulfurococcales archaeon]MCE4629168.1 sodium:solute symporter family protein [Desulfurococcales archaeon]